MFNSRSIVPCSLEESIDEIGKVGQNSRLKMRERGDHEVLMQGTLSFKGFAKETDVPLGPHYELFVRVSAGEKTGVEISGDARFTFWWKCLHHGWSIAETLCLAGAVFFSVYWPLFVVTLFLIPLMLINSWSRSEVQIIWSKLIRRLGGNAPKPKIGRRRIAEIAVIIAVVTICGVLFIARPTSEQCEELMKAVEGGKVGEVEAIISSDPSIVNCQPSIVVTPILEAVRYQHHDIVRVLLEAGADPNQRCVYVPLHYALMPPKPRIAAMLLEHGAEVDLFSAAGLGRLHKVQSFIGKSGSVVVMKRDKRGYIPLHYAVANNRVATTEVLLSKGTAISTKTRIEKLTPLHLAVEYGNKKLVRFLIEHGADPLAESSTGETPLDIARSLGRERIVALLMDHMSGE